MWGGIVLEAAASEMGRGIFMGRIDDKRLNKK